ncbi:exodeoxyribonuclease I [Aestuariibacter salexigens]|uniref:exodeoxyribonuclease I n=1 Tax=Aestuariibacter salexigens TaxID=226010 RepID=UPI00040AC3C0|nr:exodeoxyribonuclease I [Aestuariibacter salexigens]
MSESPTILWHDYETWGVNPAKDLPCQFAAIRTDLELNPVGSPINIMCQIANDYLPHPGACLVTGITPQQSLRDGMIEAEFVAQIHRHMTIPNTCVAGYNSIRFDDEVTRYALYRNFFDPYGREWQQGNSRWDIIDLVRACYALRPEGIVWPERDDGAPSFKLEHLTAANELGHQQAHDALSDVHATIAVAKLIKTKQPKLYEFYYALRKKKAVAAQLDCLQHTPFVHISSKLPALQGCCAWMMPVVQHPTQSNAVICIDLTRPCDMLLEYDAETLRSQLYARSEDLGEQDRPPLKLVHLNRSPFVAPAKTLTPENAERLGIDRQACLKRLDLLKNTHGLVQKLATVFDDDMQRAPSPPDQALYEGFIADADTALMQQVHDIRPEQLDSLNGRFSDTRLNQLLTYYRARNYPATLTHDEAQRWQQHRQARLIDGEKGASIALAEFQHELTKLAETYRDDANKQAILRALYQYAQNL